MKTYKNNVTIPGAWVVNPEDRGRKSIKGDKVYLGDGEEFIIELHNPTQNTVLANIKLDGKPISLSGIVVYPGQRVYLDHFPESGKKFTFTTYEVSDDEVGKNATVHNGVLEVNFHKEEVLTINSWVNHRTYVTNPWVTQPYVPYSPSVPYSPQPIWYGDTVYPTGQAPVYSGRTSDNSNWNRFKSELDQSGFSYEVQGGTITTKGMEDPKVFDAINSIFKKTGITTGGEQTEQKLTEVDMDFQATILSQTILQLLPESRKPYVPKKHKKNPKVDSDEFDGPHRELVQLEKLKDMGYLTPEEYQQGRKEIVRRIIG
jgi:hypothetical protein